VAHPVVDELVAVHVPLARPQRALHVDREGLEVAAVVGDPAGNDGAGPLVERRRLRMPRAVRLDHLGVVARLAHLALPPRRLFDWSMAATRSSSRMPVWAPEGKRSTVGSARRVTPSTAPAWTQASTMACSSSLVWRRSRPARRESSATMP